MDNRAANIWNLAGFLYDTYCHAVGGVAFNGDKLPTWEEFKADASKGRQVLAWCAVAEASIGKPLTTPQEQQDIVALDWKDAEEELPENKESVLVLWGSGGTPTVATLVDDTWYNDAGGSALIDDYYTVSKWARIPAPQE